MSKLKICVVRNDQIGDVMLTSPMLQVIKESCPNAELSVIAQEMTAPILRCMAGVDHVIIDYRQQFRDAAPLLLIKMVRALKEQQFDRILFAHFDPLYVLAARFAGIPQRVGDANRLGYSSLLTHKISQCWHDFTLHEADQQLRLWAPFHDQKKQKNVKFDIPKTASQRVHDWLGSQDYIVLHVGFGKGNRILSAEQYAKLITAIQEKMNLKVVLTGGESEKAVTDVLMEKSQSKPLNLVSKTSLIELMALINNASCVIGAETGPLHIAAVLKRPVVSLSPTKYTKSFRWGPYQTNHVVISENKTCDLICHTYKRPCDEPMCIDSIHEDHVVQAITFLSKQAQFPENALYYWFKTSATVAIHVEKLDAEMQETLFEIARVFRESSIHWVLTTSSLSTYKSLEGIHEQCFYKPRWSLIAWARFMATADITVWHALQPIAPLWRKIIQKLMALHIDHEPVWVQSAKKPGGVKSLLALYCDASRHLSQP